MEKLRGAFEQLDQAVTEHVLAANEDYAFHLAICQAAHNRFYVGMLEYLHENIVTGIQVARSLSLRRSASRLAVVQREHEAIITAIEKSDPESARTKMRRHIENARHRVFEGVDHE